jgi:hypothetical protein
VNLPAWPSIISVSAMPVVIISACGLLSLAFYGRLAAVVSRLRGFQREILVEQEKLARTGEVEQSRLIEVLRTQTEQVTKRARLIRLALSFFLLAVAQLILCSLTLVTSWFVRSGVCVGHGVVLGGGGAAGGGTTDDGRDGGRGQGESRTVAVVASLVMRSRLAAAISKAAASRTPKGLR